ncbi:MAG: T9SS type A sorting domain-containing protein, partial [Flavobacteriales bacterium]
VYQNGSELHVAINSLEKEGAYVIELFDLSGRTISSMTTSPVNGSMSHIFNVSALPKAAYIVRVGNSGIQRTQKIVLQ